MSAVALPPHISQRVAVSDPVPIMDTARFEHMQRVALVMANCSLIPESLYMTGTKGLKTRLPHEVVVANCFMIVNQAQRWGMDPFSVAQSASVVRGKLCFEGKLVAAVLDAKAGIVLEYEWNDKTGDAFGIKVSGVVDGKVRSIEGTVGEWKTSGDGSPWDSPKNHRRMLAYRGSREWARLYRPAVMLGVYSEDEMEDLAESARASRARVVPEMPPMPGAPIAQHEPTKAAEDEAPVKDGGEADRSDEAAPAEQQAADEAREAEQATAQPPEEPDPDSWAEAPEDFVEQAKAIREAIEGAKDLGELTRVLDTWADRVSEMPTDIRAELRGVAKATTAKLKGAA